MNKQALMFALTLPALALGACGGEGAGGNTGTAMVDNGMMAEAPENDTGNSMLGDALGTTGQQFADTAAASDAYEIAAGNLAREKATSQALKDFGAMMVTHHTQSTAKLKTAAAAAKPTVVPHADLNEEQEANLSTLRDATGTDFDVAYKTQQIAAHEKTLTALQSYAATGDVPELKAHAGATAPIVQEHLEKIRDM